MRYLVLIQADKPDENKRVGYSFYLEAESAGEALAYGGKEAHKKYHRGDGWINHEVKAEQRLRTIEDTILSAEQDS